MSWDEWEALGETHHHEFYDGLLTVDPPTIRHSVIAGRLTATLAAACPSDHVVLPEAGWALTDHTVFVPDLVVASSDRLGRDLLRSAPLLVVEITSPSTRSEDLGRKVRAYADGRCPWYLVVDPDADSVTLDRLRGDAYVVVAAPSAPGRLTVDEPLSLVLDLGALLA